MYKCQICKSVPNSHSLKVLEELDGVVYLYTCPAKAIHFDDRDGILQHYRGVLTDLQGKPWVWIFDARDFSIKHYLQFRLAKDMAFLICEFSDTLKEIQIYNANKFIRMTYNVIHPFLNERVHNSIRFC